VGCILNYVRLIITREISCIYRVSINDCRVQPAMESCQILNVPLCSAINECHIFRLGCWLLTRDKFQLCFTLANINVFII
jgi:hypothetical protein